MPRPLRILIAGFGPFPGVAVNPSASLVRRIAQRRRPALAHVLLRTHVFSTRYAAVDRDLAAIGRDFDPDAILLFGLAERARQVRIETRARNVLSFFPDAGGYSPQRQTIVAGAAARTVPRALCVRLRRAAGARGVRAVLSRDAGRYVCNYALWQALQGRRENRPRLAAFIHIPRTGKRRRGRALGKAALEAAAQDFLLTMAAALRRAALAGGND